MAEFQFHQGETNAQDLTVYLQPSVQQQQVMQSQVCVVCSCFVNLLCEASLEMLLDSYYTHPVCTAAACALSLFILSLDTFNSFSLENFGGFQSTVSHFCWLGENSHESAATLCNKETGDPFQHSISLCRTALLGISQLRTIH